MNINGLLKSMVAALLAAGLILPGARAVAYSSAQIQIEGHGFGHGIGMGQYGAWGASRAGLGHEDILRHYYTGIDFATLDPINAPIRVKIDPDEGTDTTVASGFSFSISAPGCGPLNTDPSFFWRSIANDAGSLRVERQPVTGGEWQVMCAATGGPVDFASSPGDPAIPEYERLLRVYLPATVKYYRGSIRSVRASGGSVITIDTVGLDDYCRGGVIREMPSSWADPANGGAEALKAQTVAYRSYAESVRNPSAPYDICSTTACQVYGGAYEGSGGGAPAKLETANGDAAVSATSGKVMKAGSETVFAQYSSSTGGYSKAGSKPYLAAQPDLWDPVPNASGDPKNPNHIWRVSVPAASIESAFGVGTLRGLVVTKRNGLGDWGGRVSELRIEGSKASKTVSGGAFRSALGLRSEWFRFLPAYGYWVLGADGGIFAFGNAQFFGSTGAMKLNKPIVGMAPTPGGDGYWLVASDGGIFAFGSAQFFGSTGALELNKPIVGMAATPSGNGYWLVASDGGIFAFGSAQFFGSTGALELNKPIVAISSTPSGGGYWLVASDGGIFAFGDAGFFGSTGAIKLNQPIVGMAVTPSGNGYWLVASDGGIFSFGDAHFYGSVPGLWLSAPAVVTSIAATPTAAGYVELSRDGRVFTFGDAAYYGSVPDVAPASTTAKLQIALSSS